MNLRTAVPGFLMAGILVAVSPAAGKPRFGVETGVNLSTLDYDQELPVPDWNNGWRPSFTAGGLVEFPFRERWSFVAGVRYLQQGNSVDFTVSTLFPPVEFQIVQSYVSFPLKLELRPLPSPKVFLSVGPELGVLIGGRMPRTLSEFTFYDNIRTQLAPTNLLIDLGMGVRLPVENHEATLEVRYAHGVTEAAKDEDWFSNWKTRGIETLVGMRW